MSTDRQKGRQADRERTKNGILLILNVNWIRRRNNILLMVMDITLYSRCLLVFLLVV